MQSLGHPHTLHMGESIQVACYFMQSTQLNFTLSIRMHTKMYSIFFIFVQSKFGSWFLFLQSMLIYSKIEHFWSQIGVINTFQGENLTKCPPTSPYGEWCWGCEWQPSILQRHIIQCWYSWSWLQHQSHEDCNGHFVSSVTFRTISTLYVIIAVYK